jgi:DNA mismatch repair protein MutS2
MFHFRPLEFDRIIADVAALSVTPQGRTRLEAVEPAVDVRAVTLLQQGTSETVRFFERNQPFPLRAGPNLTQALAGVGIEGRPLDPLELRGLAEFIDSVERSRAGIMAATGSYPLLEAIVGRLASFKTEIAAVRDAIDVSGEVLDAASPALRGIRDRLRGLRQRLRQSLEQFVRGKDTGKYLQDEVITERNGRFVLLVRAEHRSNVPGIVHGSSASGASLFLEPAATVEVNNDIVELEEREREEIFRILLALTDRFRQRPGDLRAVESVATELDVLQARARHSARLGGLEPTFVPDGSFELRGARHPLLEKAVPIDVVLDPPSRVLLITGPNTGGKTVALKTAGLFALMAQSGLHVPADTARLPVFKSVFADIGDEQSIAASLSTFSAHITNLVAMDRALALPALVLLDEVGTGTDPNEGGALATALVNHFRQRGAHLIATTHFDAVKTWGTATDGVTVAGFAFNPQTYAPTYRLIYGAPGRSLAIEMAQRLGMPLPVIAAARGFLGDDQKRLQAHLDRIDAQARALDAERTRLDRERRAAVEQQTALVVREKALAEREDAFKKRLNEKVEERVRQARRDIDAVIADLKQKSDALVERASLRAAGVVVNTGESGAARADARDAIERIAEALRNPAPPQARRRGRRSVGHRHVRPAAGRRHQGGPRHGPRRCRRLGQRKSGRGRRPRQAHARQGRRTPRDRPTRARVCQPRAGQCGHGPARGHAQRNQRHRLDGGTGRRSRVTLPRRCDGDRPARAAHRPRAWHRPAAEGPARVLEESSAGDEVHPRAREPGRWRCDAGRTQGLRPRRTSQARGFSAVTTGLGWRGACASPRRPRCGGT